MPDTPPDTVRDPAVARLVHRVLQPGFAGDRRAPDWLARALENGLGGVVYFRHNIGSVETTAALSASIHAAGEALIATDEEGGIVSRLGARDGSPHVGAATLGRFDDEATTTLVAAAIGRDLRASGIDMNLAPVVDVNSNPANPVIGVRSFGASAQLVARHGAAYVRGIQQTGVLATAKHFPGHGDTSVDSHAGLPRVDAPLELLRRRELAPFAAAINAGVQAVMTAHVVLAAVDADRPATLSPTVLRMLRRDLGFDGLIVTDALDMGAITGTVGLGEGCVRALLAGADLLGLGNPVLGAPDADTDIRTFTEARTAIAAAVGSGRLPVTRLEEAAARVGAAVGWVARARTDGSAPEGSGTPDLEAAAGALLVHGNIHLPQRPVQIVDLRRRRNAAAGHVVSPTVAAVAAVRPGSRVTEAYDAPDTAEGHADDRAWVIRDGLPDADVVVVDDLRLSQPQAAVLHDLLGRNREVIVLGLGDVPEHEAAQVPQLVCSYGDSLPTARAVAQALSR